MRAGSVLLVDYSCAIRLATPLTILSAMSEAARRGTLIKGGRFFESLAKADTMVFDKTGTLTEARPEVAEIIPFGKYDVDTVLRLAACLEEHFPHPVGQAVVYASERKKLQHREEHAEVEFIVAHGIASKLRGKRVLIGSEHFIVEDSGIALTHAQQTTVRQQAAQGRSLLYLAVGEALAGIIAIEDKLRPGMPDLIAALRNDGFERVIMLPGDGPMTAEAVAGQAGISEFKARLLPEQKAQFVAQLQAEGATVLMLGDGVNDAPALSAADAGAALTHGADLTKEVADIVLTRGDPADILLARTLARLTLARIRCNFRKTLIFNSVFLAGGLSGVLSPGVSAFLHNACTAALAIQSMTPLLPEPSDEEMQA
jgi:Cu2+-exporting ATPase